MTAGAADWLRAAMGMTQREPPRIDEAFDSLQQALGELAEAASILDGLGASRHAARSWIELAHVLADSGQVQEALAAYENAARTLNIGDPRWDRRRG